MNSYNIHQISMEQGLFLYKSDKQIYGKKIKNRLFRKWHHRYIRERNIKIKNNGQHKLKEYNIFYGCIVYIYRFYLNGKKQMAYTSKPLCQGSYSVPLNYALSYKINN